MTVAEAIARDERRAQRDQWRAAGQVVGTARYWRKIGAKINKGERAVLYITGGPHTKFAPVAAFAACQTSAAAELAPIEIDVEGSSPDEWEAPLPF